MIACRTIFEHFDHLIRSQHPRASYFPLINIACRLDMIFEFHVLPACMIGGIDGLNAQALRVLLTEKAG